MKKIFIHTLFVSLAFVALALTACGGAPPAGYTGGSQATPIIQPETNSGQGSDTGGGADMSIAKDILLDPANAADADSLFVLGYLYEGLVKLENDALAPALAESWSVSDDGLDYIFHLRPNLAFHDGTPVNADAVIANFNRWFDKDDPAHGDGAYAAWASIFGGFKGETGDAGQPKSVFDGAEKVDDYTVLIHLAQPDAKFVAKLVNPAFSIASPAAFGAEGFGTSTGKAAGTGPYKLSAWDDTGLTLEPFAAYWNGAQTDTLVFPFK